MKLRSRLVLAAALGVLVTASIALAGTTAGAPPKITLPTKPMSADDAQPIVDEASFLVGLLGENNPGLLIGVWDPAKGVYVGGFGKADLASGRAPTPNDAFRIGSVTKTFTATLVLQLVSEGKLKLDGRVGDYVPKLVKRHPEIGRVTIRQLLAMRSGLPEYTDAMVATSPSRGWTHKIWEADQLIDFAFKTGQATTPDPTQAIYTNTNYVILGDILAAVTGKTPRELVQTRLLKPLGLTHTLFPRLTDPTLPGSSTHGYVTRDGLKDFIAGSIQPGTDVTDWSPSWGSTAGIMTSTLGDLARWAAARFGSAFLPPALAAERSSDAAPLDKGSTYSLGLQHLGQWEGHFGGIPGWTTMALRNTKTGTIVIASVNACCGNQTSYIFALLQILYPGTTGS